MAVKPLENLTLPVSAADMAAFLGLATPLSAQDSAMIEAQLRTACAMVTGFTNREFLARKYALTVKAENLGQGPFMRGVKPVWPEWDNVIKLPFAPVVSVEAVVAIDCENVETELTADDDYYADIDLEPGKVRIDHFPTFQKLRIEFTAGYDDEYEIPAEMLLAVKMLAAWLFERRGNCDANEALSMSGARSMLSAVSVRFSL